MRFILKLCSSVFTKQSTKHEQVSNTLAHRVLSGRAASKISDGRILTRGLHGSEHEDLRRDQGAVQVKSLQWNRVVSSLRYQGPRPDSRHV